MGAWFQERKVLNPRIDGASKAESLDIDLSSEQKAGADDWRITLGIIEQY